MEYTFALCMHHGFSLGVTWLYMTDSLSWQASNPPPPPKKKKKKIFCQIMGGGGGCPLHPSPCDATPGSKDFHPLSSFPPPSSEVVVVCECSFFNAIKILFMAASTYQQLSIIFPFVFMIYYHIPRGNRQHTTKHFTAKGPTNVMKNGLCVWPELAHNLTLTFNTFHPALSW